MCGTLSKNLCEIHNYLISLPVTAIQCMFQIAYHVMVELKHLGFAGPLTSETMLTVSKNTFKGNLLLFICSKVLPQMQVRNTGFKFAASYRDYIRLSQIIWYSALSK